MQVELRDAGCRSTFHGLLIDDLLSREALIQNVDHLSAHVDEDNREAFQ